MKLNIILDSRRIEKYHPLMDQLEKQGITDFELWPCVIDKEVVTSINLSHKMIVRDALEKGLEEVIIAEDDLFFPAPDGWEYFLKNKPNSYDLYLSGTYIVTEPLEHICGFHLYMVHSRFYEKFLAVPDNKHIDTEMNNAEGEFRFCYPFAALQRPGFSANNMTIVNYNGVLKDSDVYGGLPQ